MSLHVIFRKSMTTVFILTALLSAAVAPTAQAQRLDALDADCEPAWVPTFGGGVGVDRPVNAMTVFDDGSGPALYVGGEFRTAGGVAALGIATWNGQSWSLVGRERLGKVKAMTVFDDGTGPALYVGGSISTAGSGSANGTARWDGQTWSPLGIGVANGLSLANVNALTVFDDGTGPALYAGGQISTAGGVPANNIARWDGKSWSPLGSGVDNGVSVLTHVHALAVFDDGSGPALFVGGRFTIAGGVETNGIAKWDGSSWSAVGHGFIGNVHTLTLFDDGSGLALYAGGVLGISGPVVFNNIARWDGTSWTPLGSGLNSFVFSLSVFDDGAGPALYAGGNFSTADGAPANHIAKWDGQSWATLGPGVGHVLSGEDVRAMAVFDDGSGPLLFAGGSFSIAGGLGVNGITNWDGQSWGTVGNGLDRSVNTLTVFDDGSGPALYVGGEFTTVGGAPANHIIKWDGASWSRLGDGVGEIPISLEFGSGSPRALTPFDDGSGLALYAGGTFKAAGGAPANGIAKWDGQSWTRLGKGVSGTLSQHQNALVSALSVFDDGSGPALYVAGKFITAGSVTANDIAKWDGQSWSSLRNGMNPSFVGVRALAVFDDGAGPALYAGGNFTLAGGVKANHIAKWDGQLWKPLASGVGGDNQLDGVVSLAVFDDGSGPALYAGGYFTTIAGKNVHHIAKWDGRSWSPVGNGLNNVVTELIVFDDGSGPALYSNGYFTFVGNIILSHIVRWDGLAWSPVGSGSKGATNGMAVFDDGSGPALFAGGIFQSSPGNDAYLAKYQGCPPPPNPADRNGDGVVNGADLAVLLTNWGPCLNSGPCRADLNSDGVVDSSDLAFLLGNWG